MTEEKHNTLLQYYTPISKEEQQSTTLDEEGIRNHLAFLCGKKNISIDVGASKEFYDFIVYCIAYGMQTQASTTNYLEEAKKAYHHFKQTSLSQTLITIAKEINIEMIQKFKTLIYCCVSIDEGKTAGNCNLDFILENPLSIFAPYPIYTEVMESCDADGYVQHLLNGLSAINRYGITIGSVVCDGNLAQKKAFSFDWSGSLRNLPDYGWLRSIIFVPCLCHRINCSYKNVITHDPQLMEFVDNIRQLAGVCKENQSTLGKKCPVFVSTRWICDYDIVSFLLKNQEHIQQHLHGIEFPSGMEQFFQILKVHKILISIFESPNTFFFKAFMHIERALNTLNVLISENVPCSEDFKESLLKYTLRSEEGGLLILVHLFTTEGHDDMYVRILKKDMTSKYSTLVNSEPELLEPEDPLEEVMNQMIDQMCLEDYAEVMGEEGVEQEEQEMVLEANEGRLQTTTEMETQTEATPDFSNTFCDTAKQMLLILLSQDGYSKKSTETILSRFNWYLDTEHPFPNHRTEDQVGFSWKQIAMSFPDFEPIASVALRLLNSATSEASC